ncbi:major facilitator superfamily domain-containing protein [Scenedesmus sp. NREL 46B-D3]|nr:major facilitator superfamily domain-containing protein [Scenedesmus sp. NREL 46B-D3]
MQLAPSTRPGFTSSSASAAAHQLCRSSSPIKRNLRANGLLVKEPYTSRIPTPVQTEEAVGYEKQQRDMTAGKPPVDQLFLAKAWNFLSGSSGAFVVPYIPLLLSQHGMSATQIGLLAALRPFLAAPSQMVASAVADKRKVHVRLLLFAAVVSCALRSSLPLADSVVLLFVLLLASEAVGAPVNVLADSTVLSNCKDAGDYGKQRVWASIGWGAASLPAGLLISQAGIASGFMVFGLASIPLVCVASQLRYNYSSATAATASAPAPAEQQQHQAALQAPAGAEVHAAGAADAQQEQEQRQLSMRQLLQQPAVLSFLWKCLLMGFGLGVMGTYEFLWLKQLGAPETLMGMALLMNVCTEVPAFQMQGAIMRRMAAPSLLNLVLAATALRLAAYAALPAAGNPWAVLPVELLHGITFGVGFSTATVYSGKLAPPQLAATFQGMWQATYAGVGAGVGGLLGGLLMERCGGQGLFMTAAAIVAAGGLAGACVEKTAEALQASKAGSLQHDKVE